MRPTSTSSDTSSSTPTSSEGFPSPRVRPSEVSRRGFDAGEGSGRTARVPSRGGTSPRPGVETPRRSIRCGGRNPPLPRERTARTGHVAGTSLKPGKGEDEIEERRTIGRMLPVLLLVLVLLPGAGLAGLQVVGRIPNGPCFDIAGGNGYLFAAQGAEVRVYDVSSPEKIRSLDWKGYVARFFQGSAIRGLTLEGGTLYIADQDALGIADVSDPRHPRVTAILSHGTGGILEDVAVSGNYAYLSIEGAGIQVVDVSDKARPARVRTIPVGGSDNPWRIAVNGKYLYVAGGEDARLDIFDLRDPGNPVRAGSYTADSQGSFSSVAVKDRYAYVAEYYTGVRIIDVSDPRKPLPVTMIPDINANDIKILGSRAFVSTRYEGFRIYDISSPGTMTLAGTGTGISGYTEGIFPTPVYTYLALESLGLGIWDSSGTGDPVFMVQVPSGPGTDSLVVRDPYLYLGGHNYGIWIVDVSDPVHPAEVSVVENGGRNGCLAISGDTLYAAGDWEGLCVYGLSDPLHPSLLTVDFGNDISTLLPDGEYVYTGGSNSLFAGGIVDASRRSSPKLISTSPYMKGKFAMYGRDYLLVADTYGTGGLHMLDVSNKNSPTLVSTFREGEAFADVTVIGDTAVALTGNDLITLDIRNLHEPVLLGSLSFPGEWAGSALAADGPIVYASGYGKDPVRSFDVSNPSRIRLIDTLDLPAADPYPDITFDKQYVYTGNKFGAYILSKSSILPGPGSTAVPTPGAGTPGTPAPVSPAPGGRETGPASPENPVGFPWSPVAQGIGDFFRWIWHFFGGA